MCKDEAKKLTFETLLHDPLVKLVMESDGVSMVELVSILEAVSAAREARDRSRREVAKCRRIRQSARWHPSEGTNAADQHR